MTFARVQQLVAEQAVRPEPEITGGLPGVRPPLYARWRTYLGAEDGGHRPQVLAALDAVLDAVVTVADRDDLARAALRARERLEHRMPLREPLRARVLRPFVRGNLADPQVIWWTLHGLAEYDLLAAYRDLDRIDHSIPGGACLFALSVSGEPRWWRTLLAVRIGAVAEGTHHLDEGYGVVDGTLHQYLVLLCSAVAIVDQAPPGVLPQDLLDDLAEQWSLLRDRVRSDSAGRPDPDFPAWCRAERGTHWVAAARRRS